MAPVRPRSRTEPFDDEMELKEEKVKRWLVHFGLLANEKDWQHTAMSLGVGPATR